jgi:hypothetical protein
MASLFDEVLKAEYRRFDVPADELVRTPELAMAFCECVRRQDSGLETVSNDVITRRLIQLRKRGESRGGLPRIRN